MKARLTVFTWKQVAISKGEFLALHWPLKYCLLLISTWTKFYSFIIKCTIMSDKILIFFFVKIILFDTGKSPLDAQLI